MLRQCVLAGAALVAGTAAQIATYSSGSYAVSVNVPSDTASSGSGSIFVQISAPSGTQWIGFGQGSRMSGANMLVVYAADSSNVTVSPRLGTGEVQPQFNSEASVTLLDGSGVASDGSLVANIRCDSCLSWSGGSMSPTDSSSSWIMAHKSGDALDSTDQSESISQHSFSDYGTFTLDLTTGTGGSSTNPFVAASNSGSGSSGSSSSASSGSSATGSPASASQTASQTQAAGSTVTQSTTATSTGGVSVPLASTSPGSTSSSGSSAPTKEPVDSTRIGHATVMSLVFVVLFPLSALTLYLPYSNKVRHVHAPLQIITIILMLVGLGLGVKLGNQVGELDQYHMVIGYLIVAWMVFFQPVLGLLQHLHFRKHGSRSAFGQSHRWIGRAVILLGVVNGGLGFKISGPVGSDDVPTYSVVVYSVFAVIVFLVYLTVLFWPRSSAQRGDVQNLLPGEKARPRTQDYEMHGRTTGGRRI